MGLGSASQRARVGTWLLAAILPLSALALGSLHTPVLAAIAALAVVATGLVWWDAEPLVPRPAASALLGLAAFLVGWTVLSTVPLPRAIVNAIAHENADVWARSLLPLHEDGPSWIPLSLDPNAARVQVLRGVVYATMFVGALHVARRQDGVAFLERTLFVSSVVVAAGALVHPVLGARKVFGLYEPKETLGYFVDHIGPLLNMNHFAAYANIGLLVGFAAALSRRPVIPRPIAIVCVLMLGATVVWSLSRGGTATMLLGACIVALVTFGARRKLAPALAIVIVAIGGTALGLLSVFEATAGKFAHGDYSKVGLAGNAMKLVRLHPLFGVGRGAFESTFPSVREGSEYLVFTHPENIVLQWASEWGVPVAIGAFVVILWSLRPRTLLARSRPPVGPWAAIVAVGLHNLVDFNSEVPGVVVALVVCAALVTGGSGGPVVRSTRWASRPQLIVAVLGTLTAIAIAATLPFVPHELYIEERAVRDLALDRSLSREAFHARVREAMLRHPGEPYFPFVATVRAVVARDESAVPWAARALERSPVYGRVHLLLGRSLFLRNPSQARLEYRLACMQDRQLCGLDEALRLVRTYEDAMELVPPGQRGLGVLSNLAGKLGERLPSTVVRLDREILERDPTTLAPVLRATGAVLHDVRDAEPWCIDQRSACVAEGLAAARKLSMAAPEKCDGHALSAEIRAVSGEIDAAFAELELALDRVDDRSACGRRYVSLAVDSGQRARVDQALERLLRSGCEAPDECVKNLTFAATVENNRGASRRALALLKKALEREPEREDLLIEVASGAAAAGLHGEALDAYTKLSGRHPEDTRWKEAIAREREAVTRGVFQRH
jgi:tetratricopeptide (TPR) repeat protein